MLILGIETSCDETAISIVRAGGDLNNLSFEVLGSVIHSQVEMHAEYGGVVPNLAKREHQRNLLPVLIETLKKVNLISNFQVPIFNEFSSSNFQTNKPEEIWRKFLDKIEKPKIDLIAVTIGPGLEPALWTGINFAQELGRKWNIPTVGVNHMEGHIASVLLGQNNESGIMNYGIKFPAIALLISGGHTELVFLKNWVEKKKIGETQDDAVGEAFDKVARMLGLPYPGGPEISKLAEEARLRNIHLDKKFPRPMIHSKDLNFSFSGLKTAVLYYLRKTSPPLGSNRNVDAHETSLPSTNRRGLWNKVIISREKKIAVAHEFEDAVIETLISKTKMAIEEVSNGTFGTSDTIKTLIIGGGVIANKALREGFLKLKEKYTNLSEHTGIEILIPDKSLTTDNATMIAAAGYIEYLQNLSTQAGKKLKKELKAQGNLDID